MSGFDDIEVDRRREDQQRVQLVADRKEQERIERETELDREARDVRETTVANEESKGWGQRSGERSSVGSEGAEKAQQMPLNAQATTKPVGKNDVPIVPPVLVVEPETDPTFVKTQQPQFESPVVEKSSNLKTFGALAVAAVVLLAAGGYAYYEKEAINLPSAEPDIATRMQLTPDGIALPAIADAQPATVETPKPPAATDVALPATTGDSPVAADVAGLDKSAESTSQTSDLTDFGLNPIPANAPIPTADYDEKTEKEVRDKRITAVEEELTELREMIVSLKAAQYAKSTAPRRVVTRRIKPQQSLKVAAVSQPKYEGQLLSVDMWGGKPSVVVSTGNPTDKRVRILSPGDSFNGITLREASVQNRTASFDVGGGKTVHMNVEARP